MYLFSFLFFLQPLEGKNQRRRYHRVRHRTSEHKTLSEAEFPPVPLPITCRPPPHHLLLCLWPDRKWSSSDVLYGPWRLGRNQDVMLGCRDDCVSTCRPCFVSLQVISSMDNDRYTFPAIFHSCRRWGWGGRVDHKNKRWLDHWR